MLGYQKLLGETSWLIESISIYTVSVFIYPTCLIGSMIHNVSQGLPRTSLVRKEMSFVFHTLWFWNQIKAKMLATFVYRYFWQFYLWIPFALIHQNNNVKHR